MNKDLKRAVALLKNHRCALCKGETEMIFNERGIAPALAIAESGDDLSGAAVADAVIGKATAMLYALAGVTSAYARVLSRRAIPIFERFGIEYSYEELADCIINRSGDGTCPMEKAVELVDDPQEALAAVKQKLSELRQKAEN